MQHPIGLGSYTIAEAARLLRLPTRNVRRWLLGYEYNEKGETHFSPSLWQTQYSYEDNVRELDFRDLIELRFVAAFLSAGLNMKSIRTCLNYAKTELSDDRPFSTLAFRTDGKTIFLEVAEGAADSDATVLDLRKRQFVIPKVIEQTFKDLDIEDAEVRRWRPLRGKSTIVLDPTLSFGQPITAEFNVPTAVLSDAVESEGSIDKAAWAYEVTPSAVRDALKYEAYLRN